MAGNDSELLRMLRGELGREQSDAMRRRLAEDASLRAEYAALERVWNALGPDPAVPPRPGFSTAVCAQARAEGRPGGTLSWSLAPAWAKAAAVLALVAGAAIGSSLMMLGGDSGTVSADTGAESATMTLADDYAAALQSPDAGTVDAGAEARQ